MPFGDLVAPRIYQDQSPSAFTIVEFFRATARALLAAGFKPLPSWGFMFQDVPVEAVTLDMTYAQQSVAPDGASLQYRHPAMFFDFPDDVPTFIDTDGVEQKFVFEMRHYFAGLPNSNVVLGSGLYCYLIIDIRTRRTDVDPATHWYAGLPGNSIFQSVRKARGQDTTKHNFGSYTDTSVSPYVNAFFPNGRGQVIRNAYWQISRNDYFAGLLISGASAAARVERFAVRNILVAVSPAGVLFQVGRGTRKTEAGDVFNMGLVFSQRRVPGRGIAPASDSDLDETCPAIYHFFDTDQTDNDGEYSDTLANGNRLNGVTFGARFTRGDGAIVRHSGPVKCRTFCLENLDLMDRPIRDRLAVLDSPRDVGGLVRHILSPMVYMVYASVTTPVEYLTPLFPGYSTSVTLARWRDAFYTDRFVITDQSAPGGFYEDPTSGREFYLFQMKANAAMLGMDVTGRSAAAYVAPVHPLIDTTDIVTTSGSLVSVGPVTITETGKSGSWTYTGGGEIQHIFTTGEVANATVWTFNVNADPLDYFYVLEFEYRCRGTNAADGPLLTETGTIRQQYFNNPLQPQCRDTPNGTYRDCFGDLLGCAGTNTADVNYEYRVVRIYLRRTVGVTKNIEFRFIPDYYAYPGGGGAKTILMRNMKLRRYQFNY